MTDKKRDSVVIYNTYPPQPYGNLKKLCEDKGFNYNSYKSRDFPFMIGEVEVFKIPVKRGGRKIKTKRINPD